MVDRGEVVRVSKAILLGSLLGAVLAALARADRGGADRRTASPRV
jgi:hypothetical protein